MESKEAQDSLAAVIENSSLSGWADSRVESGVLTVFSKLDPNGKFLYGNPEDAAWSFAVDFTKRPFPSMTDIRIKVIVPEIDLRRGRCQDAVSRLSGEACGVWREAKSWIVRNCGGVSLPTSAREKL